MTAIKTKREKQLLPKAGLNPNAAWRWESDGGKRMISIEVEVTKQGRDIVCPTNGSGPICDIEFCDELSSGRMGVSHTGWFADAFEDNTYRGVVVLLRGRRSAVGYVDINGGCLIIEESSIESYELGSEENGNWTDHYDEVGRASEADDTAKYAAEEHREADEYWQACSNIAERQQDNDDLKEEIIAIKGSRKKLQQRACMRLQNEWENENTAIEKAVDDLYPTTTLEEILKEH